MHSSSTSPKVEFYYIHILVEIYFPNASYQLARNQRLVSKLFIESHFIKKMFACQNYCLGATNEQHRVIVLDSIYPQPRLLPDGKTIDSLYGNE